MGYFSNGSEGDDYQLRVCSGCAHHEMDGGCPVWNLHMDHNYEEANNEGSFLHVLIPIDNDEWNKKCAMHLPRNSNSLLD